MLATIALCVATSAMIRAGKARYVFVTLLPLTWLIAVTMTAGIEKIFSTAANVGFLAHAALLKKELAVPATTIARASELVRLVWNDRIDAAMTAIFIAVVVIILGDSIRAWLRLLLSPGAGRSDREEAAA